MSLFIAGEAFPEAADFAAAKIAIFIASIVAANNRHINSFTEDCGSERRRWRQSARPQCVAQRTEPPIIR